MTASSTFAKTLEFPGLWRRRLAQVRLSASTLAKLEGEDMLAKLEGEDVAHELRRLYVDSVTELQWDVKVRMSSRHRLCAMGDVDERQG